MGKIYVTYYPTGGGSGAVVGSSRGGDVQAFALAEDGEVVGGHYCSSPNFAKHDMGLHDSARHKPGYALKYPDGFELIWVDYADQASHAGYQQAFALNKVHAVDAEDASEAL